MARAASHEQDTHAVIDLTAYTGNIRRILAHTGPDVRLMAVVKANAYGHGITDCGRAALDAGASMLAVAYCSEGRVLREAGITAPILVMSRESYSLIPEMLDLGLTISLSSSGQLEALKEAVSTSGRSATLHINVDTGMGRSGAQPGEIPGLTRGAMDTPGVTVEGIFSHFATADTKNDPFARRQITVFRDVIAQLSDSGIKPGIVHMCNSAGILNYPEAHFDMVRPGIMTYGLLPFPGADTVLAMEPVLSLKSRITFIKDVPAGFSVSYGGTFITSRPSRLATVPIGYGLGFRRHNSNRGEAIVGDIKVPVVGRVCMDQIVIDITDAGKAAVGDPVTLIGRDGNQTITAEDHARIADTINYEIVTNIADRLPRTVIKPA